MLLDGVYLESRPGAEPIFLAVRGPTDAELSDLSAQLAVRVARWLRKKGLLPAEWQSLQAEPDALEQAAQTALCLGQLAQVGQRGQVVNPPARRPGRRTGTGAHAGYSLHASTVVEAGDRDGYGLERLLRYCARPALSLERPRETKDGRYAYELKYPSLGRTLPTASREGPRSANKGGPPEIEFGKQKRAHQKASDGVMAQKPARSEVIAPG